MKTNVTIVNEGGEEYYKTPDGDLVVVGRVKLEIGEENEFITPFGDRVKVVSGEKVYCQTPNGDLVSVERLKLDNGGEKQYIFDRGEIFYVTKDGGLTRKNVDGAQYDIVDCYERSCITFRIDAKVKWDEKIENTVNEYNAGVDEANRIGIVIVQEGGDIFIPSAGEGKPAIRGKNSLSVHVNDIGQEGLENFARRLGRAFAQHRLQVESIRRICKSNNRGIVDVPGAAYLSTYE
jgi:hypothetical protein